MGEKEEKNLCYTSGEGGQTGEQDLVIHLSLLRLLPILE